jgi:hypothetical protein
MKKHPMSKYLMCATAGAMALVPFAAHAQDMTSSTTTTTVTTTTTAEPTLVSGQVLRYYVDRSGYVTAMDVQTANGVQFVSFPANRASAIYGMYPTGGNVDVWVSPAVAGGNQWVAVGAGTPHPTVWWRTFSVSDLDWLRAEPYFDAGAREMSLSGTLEGVVADNNGEILALVLKTANDGRVLVRVPPQLRQQSPNYVNDDRVAELMKGVDVEVVGTPEAPRVGGLAGLYNNRVAASAIRVAGKSVGSIGIGSIHVTDRDTLLNWNIGKGLNDKMTNEERQAALMGYRVYTPLTTSTTTYSTGAMGTGTGMTTTSSTTTTETATGRVMIVAADNTMYPVVRRDGKLWAQSADGTLTQIRKSDGKYVVPTTWTGSRMVMVMPDGRQLNMDTVNGQLMVIMADGSMAPVTLHTP